MAICSISTHCGNKFNFTFLSVSYLVFCGVCVHDSGRSVCVKSGWKISFLCRPKQCCNAMKSGGKDGPLKKEKKILELRWFSYILIFDLFFFLIKFIGWLGVYLWFLNCWCSGMQNRPGSWRWHCEPETQAFRQVQLRTIHCFQRVFACVPSVCAL